MDFSRPLTNSERKEIMSFIDDFLYHMEDNYGMRMTQNEELKNLKIEQVCKILNTAYEKLGEGLGRSCNTDK